LLPGSSPDLPNGYPVRLSAQKKFKAEILDEFYAKYIVKLIKNDESLVLLFHMTTKMFIKYNLLEIFQKLLKKIPLEFWLSQRQAQGLEVLAVQVESLDLAVLPKLHLHPLFGSS